MYLTKLELSLSTPVVRAALTDGQRMHRLVCGFFNAGRKDAEVLYRSRVRGMLVEMYLYSAVPVKPERLLPGTRLAGQRDVTAWLDAMQVGNVFGFQLETVPFKKISGEGSGNSRRRFLRLPEEREAWLRRKADQNGFEILSVKETAGEKHIVRHPAETGGSLTVDSKLYTGTLQIIDADLFRRAVCQGIGPDKAYGMGMLLLAED